MNVIVSPRRMLIGGELVESQSGEWLESVNPATEDIIGKVPLGAAADVNRAVAAAEGRRRPGCRGRERACASLTRAGPGVSRTSRNRRHGRAPESAFPLYTARSLQRFISMGTFDDPARVIVRLPRVTTHVMAWQLLRRGCCRSCLALRSLQSIEQNYACDGTKERRNGCHIKEHLCRHC
jgi:hypothetical protein